ncbi:MAG: hypothetical protein HDR01_05710 [Lachnospiraceae bacterium]|nr:hypothetical protein [Lachnospiraceae bacterium]
MQKLIETLKSFGIEIPADKQADVKKALSEHYKNTAEHNKAISKLEADRDAKLYERDFADALKAELEGVKFTSEAAKKSVMADIKEAGLKLKDGKILGLNDLISQMKEKDASAFVDEKQEELEAQRAKEYKPFTTALNQNVNGKKMTKNDIVNIKDASQRQAAIAQNLGLFGKGD